MEQNNKPALSKFATVQEYKDAVKAFDAKFNRRAEDAERPAGKLEWDETQIVCASGDAILQGHSPGSIEYDVALVRNLEASRPAAPAVDAAELTEDEQISLMVKVKNYMQTVDLRRLLLQHEKCETEEAEIFANINALIAKRVPNALTVDAAELGKLIALAEAALDVNGKTDAQIDGDYEAFEGEAGPNSLLRIAALVAQQAARIAELEQGAQDMEERKDGAYFERNQVVAALAKAYPSGVARTAIEGWSEDWHGCVYIDLPTGQASWHFHDSQAYLFAGIPAYAGKWDGHTTEEKYARLAAIRATQEGK